VRNKAHLVSQGYSRVEGLDFGETFAPVARLEAIRILLAFATSKGFKLYQMDVQSAFLNGVIQEESTGRSWIHRLAIRSRSEFLASAAKPRCVRFLTTQSTRLCARGAYFDFPLPSH
jgi:hypothetical protein